MAKPKKAYAPRPCAYSQCGVLFTPIREWQKYHDPECRRAAAKEKVVTICPNCGTRIG